VAEPAIEIQNGTWSAGLAARVEAQLKEKQIYSNSIGNIDLISNLLPQVVSMYSTLKWSL
jgi:hypothetical protein